MADIRVGLIKAVPTKCDLAKNWDMFEDLVHRTRSRGIQLYCTPEAFLDGYAVTEETCDAKRLRELSQDVRESIYIEKLKDLAKQTQAHMIFGFTELRDNQCFNAAVLVDHLGRIIGVYHKTHLQHHDLKYAPGDSLPVFDASIGRIGIMICADRRWPETARVLRLNGAELIMNPTYGMYHEPNEWWMRTRSFENEVHICFTHPKLALITDPEGNVAGKLESNLPDVLVHDIDLNQKTTDKFLLRHLEDRRPDLYGSIVER